MIGDRNGGQAAAARKIDNLLRRIAAIAVRRMDVQVRAAMGWREGSGSTQRGKRLACGHGYADGATLRRNLSRTPLTKPGDSLVP